MNIFELKLQLIDFSHESMWKWRLRRIFVGYLLFTYYAYAAIFFFEVAMPSNQTLNLFISTNGDGSIPALLTMVTFGFIGGVFFITRTFVRTTQKLGVNPIERMDFPVVWYMTRPIQSAMMAIFIYYAFRAGQIVFYSMEGAPSEDQINIYSLSLLAITAGAFTEKAFEKLHAIAESIFKVKPAAS